ncbi:PLP-dependent aminotransferase family protein [Vibrio barjaei]|uniref:MocR-like pyridoxine biosynthesis transcription factor PdxR n=1 Tax=Vibrio barjaei TaxID=1676683 RepID=UPI0007BC0B1F|nr:PLP-dependent aminotransferase family protein [Vibrio barjaei]OIN28639.1 GntR family transcriptional regulator [Vibrio barjaei]
MLEKYIQIDPNLSLSLQDQIKTGITHAITSGFLDRSVPITSSRKLATSLKVSRNTVLRVYEQLNAEGFFVSRERKGYYINPELNIKPKPLTTRDQQQTLPWNKYVKLTTLDSPPSPQELSEYPYRFIHGMVDETTFPVAEWRKCAIQSLNKINSKRWTSEFENYDELIEQIRTRVLPRRGIFAQHNQIMVTMGTQHSLNLISRLLTDQSTTVGIENPGYPEAVNQLSAKTDRIVPIDIDEQGAVINESLHSCDLVYVTPSNQFPTTVRMSKHRRQTLLQAAEEHDFLVIEDDFEHETNFIDEDIPALKGEIHSERIIYLSSFSSTIAPGLRLGFIVAAPQFIELAKRLQQRNHTCPPKNNCQTLALFLKLGYYDSLIHRLLTRYRSKWLTMEKALNFYFPQSGVASALSGTAFWIDYKPGFDANRLANVAQQHGILINSGEKYYFANAKRNGIRLSFNSIDESDIREGIKRLALLAQHIMPDDSLETVKGQRLKAEEVREVVDDYIICTTDCFNIPYKVTFQQDGRMHGMSNRPNDEDEGYWWLEEDTLCIQWKKWQFSDVRRQKLIRHNNTLYRFDENGLLVSKGTLLPKASIPSH